jgi:hypothetical protein
VQAAISFQIIPRPKQYSALQAEGEKWGESFIFAKCRSKFFPCQSYKSCRACGEGYLLVDCGFNLEVNVILEI